MLKKKHKLINITMKQEVQTEEKRGGWLTDLCIKSGSYPISLDTTDKDGRRGKRAGACTVVGTGERVAFQGFQQSGGGTSLLPVNTHSCSPTRCRP